MQFVIGIIIGFAIFYMIKKNMGIGDNSAQLKKKDEELTALYAENEKFRKRNKDAERQIEDLLAEIQKLRKKAKEGTDANEELEDLADKYKNEAKKIHLQNEELIRQMKEYKIACEALQDEINNLKNK